MSWLLEELFVGFPHPRSTHVVFQLDSPKIPLEGSWEGRGGTERYTVKTLGPWAHTYLFQSETTFFFLYFFILPSKVSFEPRARYSRLKTSRLQDTVKIPGRGMHGPPRLGPLPPLSSSVCALLPSPHLGTHMGPSSHTTQASFTLLNLPTMLAPFPEMPGELLLAF